jgi:N-acetylglutamate synthase-like GNAT family acetyltransferase
VVVATSKSGEVVGTIAYKVLEGGEGHLRGMAVHPEWHGTGLACIIHEGHYKRQRTVQIGI